jgi:hypothetical protein
MAKDGFLCASFGQETLFESKGKEGARIVGFTFSSPLKMAPAGADWRLISVPICHVQNFLFGAKRR